MEQLKYAALLGNVDKTILRISLGNGFRIEEWELGKFVEFYEVLDGCAEHDIWFRLDEEWGYGNGRKYRPKNVYVVRKDFDSYPPQDPGKDVNQWEEVFKRRNAFESEQISILEDKILKLRLRSEGSIKICVGMFYIDTDDGPEMQSSSEELLHCENRLYRIPTRDVESIQSLLDGPALASAHKYVTFALENFEQSYRVAQVELEFITLMIAFEALFNDGKQELRNKVARGCAVLLGKTKAASREIFKEVRDLYDKRSVLVHTGDKSKISHTDVLRLKNYARQSLARVVQLGLTKDELSARLTETGFGCFRELTKNRIVARSNPSVANR